MKGKRFKEEQIIRILQEAETGLSVADICRKHNCSEQSFYRCTTQSSTFNGQPRDKTQRRQALLPSEQG